MKKLSSEIVLTRDCLGVPAGAIFEHDNDFDWVWLDLHNQGLRLRLGRTLLEACPDWWDNYEEPEPEPEVKESRIEPDGDGYLFFMDLNGFRTLLPEWPNHARLIKGFRFEGVEYLWNSPFAFQNDNVLSEAADTNGSTTHWKPTTATAIVWR